MVGTGMYSSQRTYRELIMYLIAGNNTSSWFLCLINENNYVYTVTWLKVLST
jgi:hypothetical protein